MVQRVSLNRFFRRFRIWIILGALFSGMLAVAALVAALSMDLPLMLGEARELALEALRMVPGWLFLLMLVVLPLFGAPMSPFLFTAIPVLGGPGGLYGIVGAWVGMGVGISLSFWLSGGILRPFVARWVERHGYNVPALSKENEVKVILAIRLSPLPYVVQNYILGLSGCRFIPYFVISWPVQCFIGLGFMLMGESFATGGLRYALLGAFLIVVCFLATGYFRRRLKSNGEEVEGTRAEIASQETV